MKKEQKIYLLSILLFILAPFVLKGNSKNSDVFAERRDKLRSQVKEGIILIQSSERNQINLYEFFVPNSDNHDFIFLTGVETPGATLILCPGSKDYSEILYIDGDLEELKLKTGIMNIYPTANLIPDLSNAFTDYSLLRYTQLRFKPLPSEISRILYSEGNDKIIYFNFPRFVNLEESPPKRLELIHRIQSFSPKYEIRDISDYLDKLRMYHDKFGISQLRRAARISGEAMIESMKSVTPGMTEEQLRAVFNFASYFKGAKNFGFSTSIRSGPSRSVEHFPRDEQVLKAGDLVTIDAGAEINFYSADIQRTFPVSGKFTEKQAEIYNILKRTQEICIDLVKPGVTMKQLQEAAIKALDEQGGYGKYFRWGTSHFLGMEVHDHGDNLIPFKPGICITVEPGLVLEEFTIVLEDDILCTEDGYEWLTQFVPRDIEDIERIMKEDGIGKVYFHRQVKQSSDEFK
ncbi:aminopeptidase P N-terminal domain-containing protein [Acidobacteriota bacterium]